MGKKEHNILKVTPLNCCLTLLAIGLFLHPLTSFAEVTVGSYCQLSIQSIQQQVTNFQELITLANQYSDDPDAFAAAEAAKQAEFKENTDTLMASFGMTPQEYVLYMGKHKNEVETYWNDNPTLKQQLDDLSAQAMVLITEFEALKVAPQAKDPLP